MLSLPSGFDEVLLSFVKETFYPATRKAGFAGREFAEGDFRFFAKGIEQLNRFFTSERGALPANYFNKKELQSGYLLYFLPTNALKIAGLLGEIPAAFFSRPLRVLDLGCGPATGGLGVLLRAGWRARLHLTLVDQNGTILQQGRGLLERLAAQRIIPTPDRVVTHRLDLQQELHRLPRDSYDLILLANVMNEWEELEVQRRLIVRLFRQFLAPGGRLLILEPALQRPTRRLMELHDQLALEAGVFVQAPCLHQQACPMRAANARDWCHTYLEWERPRFLERFDRLVAIRKDCLKASYLLLGNDPPPERNSWWRVVSGPLHAKGKTERLLCGTAALPRLHRLVRLDRDASPANRDFDAARRGDIVAAPLQPRLGREASFRILSSQPKPLDQPA